jgi:hypothetical protein
MNPLFQLIIFGISLVYFYWSYTSIIEVLLDGEIHPPPRAVRLSVLGLRNSSISTAEVNPLDFGLMRDGCVMQFTLNPSNGSSRVSLAAPPPLANGYYFSIQAGGPAEWDPVKWVVEAQANGSDGWRVVGASVSRGYGSLAVYFPHLAYPTPVAVTGGQVRVAVDGRPSWPWILAQLVTYLTAGCGLMMSVIFSWMHQYWAINCIISGYFAINSVLQLAAAAGFYAQGAWRDSVVACIYVAGNGVVAIMLLVNERLILSALLHFSVIFSLALVCCSVTALPRNHGSSIRK